MTQLTQPMKCIFHLTADRADLETGKDCYAGKLVMLPDITAERACVQWYRRLAGPLRTVTVHAAFLPPAEK